MRLSMCRCFQTHDRLPRSDTPCPTLGLLHCDVTHSSLPKGSSGHSIWTSILDSSSGVRSRVFLLTILVHRQHASLCIAHTGQPRPGTLHAPSSWMPHALSKLCLAKSCRRVKLRSPTS